MVLDKLSSALKNTLKKITRAVLVDENLINELVKDIQRALLQADVNVKLVFEISKEIKNRALNETPPKNIGQKEFLIKIVYDELVKFLGKEKKGIKLKNKKPFKIMLVGLFGTGKTTTIAKLGTYYSKRGSKVALVGLDVHRPAAMDQIEQLGKANNLPVYIDKKEKNPIKIWKSFEKELEKYDLILIDTAGRDALSEDLVREIEDINKVVKADENLLVINADIGQTAEKQAKQFHESCNITGVIITKMDGTAKAGGALSACSITNTNIKFIGTGEKVDDLEEFNPEGFVSRLLGMGDLEALLEKVRVEVDEETAEDLGKKFLKGDFNFLDLYEQLKSMKKMGPLNKIMELIPGMGNMKIPKDMLDVQDEKLKKWKFIMQSMTKKELENPDLVFNRKRIDRIAKGSGSTSTEVRELLKQYRQSKKMMKLMKGDPSKLMKKFKGRLPGFG